MKARKLGATTPRYLDPGLSFSPEVGVALDLDGLPFAAFSAFLVAVVALVVTRLRAFTSIPLTADIRSPCARCPEPNAKASSDVEATFAPWNCRKSVKDIVEVQATKVTNDVDLTA